MKELSEIKKKLPYYRLIFGNTYVTELTINNRKGSVVFGLDEAGYEHVSFAPYSGKTPTWDDMCVLKDIFWNPDEEAVQIHPAEKEYVNIKDNCLHIWSSEQIRQVISQRKG